MNKNIKDRISSNINLYNPKDLKYKFLENESEATAYSYAFVFDKSYLMEKMLDKDLYNFTSEEIIQVLEGADYSSHNSVEMAFRVIDKYIGYAIYNGKVNSSMKVTDTINKDMLYKFVNTSTKVLWSDKEIEEIVSNLVNYQDKAMIMGLNEGISGNDLGYTELLNLKLSDLNEDDCTVRLYNEKFGEERILEISKKTMSLLRSAALENTYLSKNGMSTGYKSEIELVKSPYIFRTAHSGKSASDTTDEKASKFLITRRFTAIQEALELNNLNAKNVRNSGMLKMAKDLYVEEGKLETPQLTKIAQRYGLKKTSDNVNYNFSLIKKFIRLENIEALYNI